MEPFSGIEYLKYSRKPSPWFTIFSIVAGFSFGYKKEITPQIKATWSSAKLNKKHLSNYTSTCGLEPGENYPIFYQMTRIFP